MAETSQGQRLDTWLDVACVFKTRSAAAKACNGGKVDVNGERGKPHKLVRPGDALVVTLEQGRRRLLTVLALEERSIPKALARTLYRDDTPPPTPEELEFAKMLRASRPVRPSRPDSREKRLQRRLKREG